MHLNIPKQSGNGSPRITSGSSPLMRKRSRFHSVSHTLVHELFNLDGKVAIVTGGYGAIGADMCRGLAKAGAIVGILGRKVEKVRALAEEIKKDGHSCFECVADVTNLKQLEQVSLDTVRQYGKIDILVNCAGGNMKGATLGADRSFFDLPIGGFKDIMNLNFHGAVLCCQVFGKMMYNQGYGNIVNVSSIAANANTLSNVGAYSSSKAALTHFTSWLGAHLAKAYGATIRCNAIAPGFIVAKQNKSLLMNEDGTTSDRGKRILAKTPMQRFGSPDELNGALIFLCSDASKFMTGSVVTVDGGFTASSGV